MTDTGEWIGGVGSVWAEEWRQTDRSFGPLTDRLLDPAKLGDFTRLLDIGCGAGELIARLAPLHSQARLFGIDISADLLAVARARCADDANASFAEADAAGWQPEDGERPDLLLSRHGVMFFPDPVLAFANLRDSAAPSARLRFSCFRAPEENGWVSALRAALPGQPPSVDPHAPGPFAFADPGRVRAILSAAGWRDIGVEPLDYPMVAGEGEGAVDQALRYFQRIGPAARALTELDPEARAAARSRMRAMLADHHTGDRVAMPAAAWIVSARAP